MAVDETPVHACEEAKSGAVDSVPCCSIGQTTSIQKGSEPLLQAAKHRLLKEDVNPDTQEWEHLHERLYDLQTRARIRDQVPPIRSGRDLSPSSMRSFFR